MSRQHPNDAEVGRVLRQASDGYADLPDEVGDRLDRVLDALPTADTLHGNPNRGTDTGQGSALERLAERLRPKRVRYALISAAAAVLVTVGSVAAALQIVAPSAGENAAGTSEIFAEEQDTGHEDDGAAPEAQDEAAPGTDAEAAESDPGTDGIPGVEAFTTGSDYGAGTDLIAALRELTSSGAAFGEVPPELADLASGGDFWRSCQDAIAHEYAGLLVAVDFARYESEPAVIALLIGDSGDFAVALSPACADGVIEQLAAQP